MRIQIAKNVALLISGLIAGTFFYGTFTVLPTFYEVSSEIHLGFRTALMKHNVIIVMALVVLGILTTAYYTWEIRKIKTAYIFCWIALIMTIISLAITRYGSVPINMMIKTWNPVSPPENWKVILERWDLYNAIRTITSIGSFIFLLISDFWINKKKE